MATKDYDKLTTCLYVVENGPDDLAQPLHVTLDMAPTTAGWIREQTFADYLHRVHQTAQKGDFIPDYYIVRYQVEHPENLPDIRSANELREGTFSDEIRMAGGNATHIISLRALEYLFDNHEEKNLTNYISTGIIGHLGDDSRTRASLDLQITPGMNEKTLNAIETAKGVLFFDTSGWGKECRQAYLQYLTDNFYNSTGREHGYVREYRIHEAPETFLTLKEQSPHAFSLYNFAFLPHKARYCERSLLEGYGVFRTGSMEPSYDAYHSFTQVFKTTTNVSNVQVQRLLYMRALGQMYHGPENRRIPLLCESEFLPYQRQIEALSQDAESNKQTIYTLQRNISDLAANILDKHYHVAPSPLYLARKESRQIQQQRTTTDDKHLKLKLNR